MRNHADSYVQRAPCTFRLPRRTKRARGSSISVLCTCTKRRGTTHGADDHRIDIKDDQLGRMMPERASEHSDPLIFIVFRRPVGLHVRVF